MLEVAVGTLLWAQPTVSVRANRQRHLPPSRSRTNVACGTLAPHLR